MTKRMPPHKNGRWGHGLHAVGLQGRWTGPTFLSTLLALFSFPGSETPARAGAGGRAARVGSPEGGCRMGLQLWLVRR